MTQARLTFYMHICAHNINTSTKYGFLKNSLNLANIAGLKMGLPFEILNKTDVGGYVFTLLKFSTVVKKQ